MLKKISTSFSKIKLFDLYLLIFLTPLFINPWGLTFYELPKFVYLTIFICLSLIALIIYFIKKGKISLNYGRGTYILLGLWLTSLTLSTIFSIAPALSFWGDYSRLQGLITHFFYAIHFIIIYQYLVTKENREKLLKFILVVSVIIAVYALIQKLGFYIFPQEQNETFVGRVYSTLGQPNFLGQYLIFPIWISFYYLIKAATKKTKILHLLILLLMLVVLGLTENRATILGLALSFVLYLSLIPKLTAKIKYMSLTAIILACIVFIAVIAPNTRSLQSRFLIWQSSTSIISQNLLIGTGPETLFLTFPKYYPKEMTQYENIMGIPDRAHNEPLDTLLNQGMVGLLIYLTAIMAVFIATIKNKKILQDKIFTTAFFAFIATIASNLFGFQLISHYLLFFTILALIAAYLERQKTLKITPNIISFFISGIIVALAFLGIWNSTTIIMADNTFGKGLDQMMENQNGEAFTNFVYANELNPNQGYMAFLAAHLITNMATNSEISELYELSNEFLDKSAQFNGPNYEYFLEKAVTNHYQGNNDLTDQYLQQAAKYAPQLPAIYQKWGAILYEREQYELAAEKLEKYLSLIPDYWSWYPDLEKMTKAEKETYRIFIKTTPGIMNSLSKLSLSYQQEGLGDKADYYLQFVDNSNASSKY